MNLEMLWKSKLSRRELKLILRWEQMKWKDNYSMDWTLGPATFDHVSWANKCLFSEGSLRWFPPYLVHSGFCNKVPETGWPVNNRNLFLSVPETGDQDVGMVEFWWQPPPGCRLWTSPVPSHSREKQQALAALIGALMWHVRDSPYVLL